MSFTTTAIHDLDDPLSPSESVIRLKGALEQHLDTPEFHEKFQDAWGKANPALEIGLIHKEVSDLEQSFARLSTLFGRHDRQAEKLGVVDVAPLRPQWNELRDRFKELLERSRTNAMDACAILRQYVNIFDGVDLHDLNIYDAMKKEIQNLLEMVEDRAAKAAGFRNAFTRLSDDVKEFHDTIQDTIDAVGEQAKFLSVQLETACEEVRDLHARLAQVSGEMSQMTLACLACLSAGALAAGIFFLKIAPEAATAAATSVITAIPLGVGAVKKWKETRKLRKAIREGENRIADLQKQGGRIEELNVSLMHAQGDLVGIAEKIDIIASIWQIIKTDMNDLKSRLSTVVAGNEVTLLFGKKISITRGVYHTLVETLDAYARETTVEGNHIYDFDNLDGDVD
ncbi:hypothetical protein PYCCODRAFT_1423520 [Trametes coccinea BRFM310]|uniref:Uncharacterized protein n=1 Tax=Trametes coccinea (strain BRFM310) TaxID=1353009 RepID=A0A1Y2IWD5_TRAC3|nr:hypothetical protein PYCCODRAFT_1423520 [Trametes coccinea BRFM310]